VYRAAVAERVLITGASGFIGRRLCARLVDDGAEVHAASRTSQAEGELRWCRVDLTDIEVARRLVQERQPEVVYHLASRVTGARDISEVVPTLQANLESTIGILLGAADCRCRRVVLAGSMEEAGSVARGPSSPYAAAKTAATSYAQMFRSLYEVPVVNLRLFMVYGPGQVDLAKVVPYTIDSLLRSRTPELTTGDRPVDWVYVDDVVEALVAAGSAEACDDAIPIDIGSGTTVTIRGVVEEIHRRIPAGPAPNFGARPDRSGETVTAADLGRARSLLGWEPQTSLAEGLDATLAWYAERLPGAGET
jgi:UDP-glucose 4-epimerase